MKGTCVLQKNPDFSEQVIGAPRQDLVIFLYGVKLLPLWKRLRKLEDLLMLNGFDFAGVLFFKGAFFLIGLLATCVHIDIRCLCSVNKIAGARRVLLGSIDENILPPA